MAVEQISVVQDHPVRLVEMIRNRTALIGVVGLGYVGLPLAVEKGKIGFRVLGFEQNPQRAAAVNAGRNYIKDVKDAELQRLITEGRLSATADLSRLGECDVIVICVPTPLTATRDPDTSYIEKTADAIAAVLRPGQLISLESTTYPGTTTDVILPRLNRSGLVVGRDFFVAFSPERVDPGNQRYTTHNISKVVGGVTDACRQVAVTFYEQTIQQVVPVSSPAVAEMTKVFENTYRAVNIALVNELTLICDRMGIDVWDVLDAAATKPFGIQVFYPGPGVGGHCIPIDPFYLTWKAREFDLHTRFIELAGELNAGMPYFVVEKVNRVLNAQRRSINGSSLLLIGMAYKKNIDDYRESPAIQVAELLRERGADVAYHDPLVPEVVPHGRFQTPMHSVDLSAEHIRAADCVLILTDHDGVDWEALVREAKAVVDTRNATRNVQIGRERIVRL